LWKTDTNAVLIFLISAIFYPYNVININFGCKGTKRKRINLNFSTKFSD